MGNRGADAWGGQAVANKLSVIERLRAGEAWLTRHGGPPMGWVVELFKDAAQELQSESGALWLQTVTGRNGHVRMFVHGPFGLKEMDLLLEILQLTRSFMERDAASTKEPPAVDAVDPQVDNTGKAEREFQPTPLLTGEAPTPQGSGK